MLHHSSLPFASTNTRLLVRSEVKPTEETSSPPLKPAPPPVTPPLALATLISSTRTTLRLHGLLSLYSWARSLLTKNGQIQDPVLKAIAWSQVFCCVLYQFLENVAYLCSKGVLPAAIVSKRGGTNQWYLWSCRFWLGHIGLEFGRLGREYVLLRRIIHQSDGQTRINLQDSGKGTASEGHKSEQSEVPQAHTDILKRRLLDQLISNIAWAPLCVHWSLAGGLPGLSEGLVGALGLLAGLRSTIVSWNGTSSTLHYDDSNQEKTS